jgi:hypothetical protein
MDLPKGWELYELIYIRGHHLPLRLTFPPPRTPHGFACSVASLSRSPCHYLPGHHSLRRAALVECPLGQGKPSTQPVGHSADTHTPSASPHSGDRKAQPSPAGQFFFWNLPHCHQVLAEGLSVPLCMSIPWNFANGAMQMAIVSNDLFLIVLPKRVCRTQLCAMPGRQAKGLWASPKNHSPDEKLA